MAIVLPIVNRALSEHRGLAIRLALSDRNVHLVDDGIDIAIRVGDLADSSLSAVKLGEVRVAPRLTANNADAAIAAAEAGIGITRTLSYQVRDSVMAGRLVPILLKFAPPPSPASAIYPARRIVSANVGAFIKIARNHFTASPLVPVQNWRVQGVD